MNLWYVREKHEEAALCMRGHIEHLSLHDQTNEHSPSITCLIQNKKTLPSILTDILSSASKYSFPKTPKPR